MMGAIAALQCLFLLTLTLTLTLIGGLMASAVTRAFQDVGWVWMKLATGISVFEGGLTAVHDAMVAGATGIDVANNLEHGW